MNRISINLILLFLLTQISFGACEGDAPICSGSSTLTALIIAEPDSSEEKKRRPPLAKIPFTPTFKRALAQSEEINGSSSETSKEENGESVTRTGGRGTRATTSKMRTRFSSRSKAYNLPGLTLETIKAVRIPRQRGGKDFWLDIQQPEQTGQMESKSDPLNKNMVTSTMSNKVFIPQGNAEFWVDFNRARNESASSMGKETRKPHQGPAPVISRPFNKLCQRGEGGDYQDEDNQVKR